MEEEHKVVLYTIYENEYENIETKNHHTAFSDYCKQANKGCKINIVCCTTEKEDCEQDETSLDQTNNLDTSIKKLKTAKIVAINYWVKVFDGSKYYGEWLNADRHGQGTCVYPGGNRYIGEWFKDKPHGQGKLINPGTIYEGQFMNGFADGQGVVIYTGGGSYSGSWKNGLKHGQNCKEEWVDGTVYVGDFENNNMHGKGLITIKFCYEINF